VSVVSCPINIQANPTLGVLSHQAITPPMPSPVINVSVEMLTFQFWIYGYATNKNKFSDKTTHKGQWIVQGGHDCGMLVPDVTLPIFPNLLYTVHWPFSKRAMVFDSSTVKMGGQNTACAAVVPPFPMNTCGQPVGAPTALSFLANLNNVYVGMTFMDIFAGVMAVALSIAIDLVFNKLGASNASQPASRTTREIMRQVVGPSLVGKLGAMELAKAAVSGLAGLATSSMRGNPTFKVEYGVSPIAGVELTLFSHDGTSGQTSGPVLQGQALGWQGDTSGNRASWGTSTPAGSGGQP
jgi:hypothetical protein